MKLALISHILKFEALKKYILAMVHASFQFSIFVEPLRSVHGFVTMHRLTRLLFTAVIMRDRVHCNS